MIADHDEHHRQGEIIVMQRALLGLCAQSGVWRFAAQQGRHHLALIRHDQQKHIGNHHGADQRAHLHEGAATAEHLIEPVGQRHQKHKTGQCQMQVRAPDF